MNKNTNLILFIVSFGALLLLMLTKLEYVMTYGKDYLAPGTGSNWYKQVVNPPLIDAQIFGVLMVFLAVGSVFFLFKVLKK